LPDAKDLRTWLNRAGSDASGEMLLRELDEWRRSALDTAAKMKGDG